MDDEGGSIVKEEKNFKAWPKGRPKSLSYPVIPIHQILSSTAMRYPDTVAMRFAGMELTYQEFLTLSHKFAHALRARGVKKGDRVAIHLPNCPQFAIAYYGIMMLGGIFVPCSPLGGERELEHQFNDAGVETLITLDLTAGVVDKILGNTKVKNLIVTSLADTYPPVSASVKALTKQPIDEGEDFLQLLDEGDTGPINEDIDPKKDIAHLAYTGGTTGLPKGVMVSHYNVVVNVIQICHWLAGGDVTYRDGILRPDRSLVEKELGSEEQPIEEGMTILVVVPWFHAMGTIGYLNNPVYAGATMIVFPRFSAEEYIGAIEKYKADMVGGAPQLFIPMVQDPEFKKVDMSRVRLAVSGAAPLPVPILQKMLETFSGVVIEGSGMTEVVCTAMFNPPTREGMKPGSVGIPVSDTYAKIVDLETGEPLPPGKEGEICMKGPQVTLGYWQKPEETAQVYIDGWVHSGDIGCYDEDGYFYITDRKKDMIIYKGHNVYPRELEEILFEHPKVGHCAVVGKKDEKGGEIPVAFIQLKPDTQATPEEIMDFVNEKLAKYKHVRELFFVDEIPVSAAGKVLKRELRERLKA
jgi:long-chain acyl-CoA synthetase